MVRIPGTRLVQLINVLTAPDLSRFIFVCIPSVTSRSTIGGGGNNFVPVSGGEGTKIVPLGDLFEQPPSEMNLSSGKLADHAGDHVVLSPERVVFVPSPGAKSLYPRPPAPPFVGTLLPPFTPGTTPLHAAILRFWRILLSLLVKCTRRTRVAAARFPQTGRVQSEATKWE